MKKFLGFILVLLTITTSNVLGTSYVWKQSHTGGGGYIIGMLQDPIQKDIFYARCDVAGIFKSIDGGKTWTPKNGGLNRWYHHYVRSIAIHPMKKNVVFRASGDLRNNKVMGAIHKSTDGGNTWREVSNEIGFFGNGYSRQFGEVVKIDPKNPGIMIAGAFSDGIWRSNDEGENWYKVMDTQSNFVCLAINPHDNLYYASAEDGKLFVSNDLGQSWNLIREDATAYLREIIFINQEGINTIIATTNSGLKISYDKGRTFTDCGKGLPLNYSYISLTVDPNNQDVLYTGIEARPHHKFAPIPIYKSVDAGKSWALIATHKLADVRNKPSYYYQIEKAGWAISKILIDRYNSDHLLFSNWYGVCESYDGGKTYDANHFKGTETSCLEFIRINPYKANNVCFSLGDHNPMLSSDNGESYNVIASGKFSSSTAITFSKFRPDIIFYGGYHRINNISVFNGGNQILKAEAEWNDAGIMRYEKGVSKILLTKEKAYIQAIEENALVPGEFYAYIDGKVSDNAGIYKSTDYGDTWNRLSLPIKGVKSLPVDPGFIENELLNITIGQVKNVCGCNQLLQPDPHNAQTVYFGEWTSGVFKSADGGNNWINVTSNLPVRKDTASVLTVIKCDKYRKNVIYAGFLREGLWKSSNGGKSWEKIYPLDNSLCNISTLNIGGYLKNEIIIGSEDHFWAPYSANLLLSSDNGKSFKSIYDKNVGCLRIKSIDVDKSTGRIFVATSGNGAFYIERR